MDTGLYELMRVFVRVADAGSFTLVAQETGQTQPTVSRQIAALERHLGRRLLTRTTRSLALTEDGRVYLASARLALEAMEEASGSLSARGGRVSGVVRLSASVAFGRLNIMPLLGKLLAAHAGLEVDLVLDDSFVDIVEEGVDIAIRIGDLPDSQLAARRIGEIERLVVAAPAYWARHGKPQHPRELSQHDCVLYTSAQGRDVWSFETPEGALKVKVNGRVRVNVSDAMREAVLAGLGVGLTPRSFWTDELERGVVEQAFTGLSPRRSGIYAVFPTRRLIPARVRAVVDFLAAEFATCPALAMR
ncbi:MAG: LysR family transcriptional regulator [Micropepsaceae bacterium]